MSTDNPIRPPLQFHSLSSTPEETISIASELAHHLSAGNIVLLSGPLGAGKTVFAAGLIHALGVTTRVTSPTFTMIAEYPGDVPIYHIDLYRVKNECDLDTLDLEDSLHGNGIAVVEWPERAPFLFEEATIVVRIEPQGDGSQGDGSQGGGSQGDGSPGDGSPGGSPVRHIEVQWN